MIAHDDHGNAGEEGAQYRLAKVQGLDQPVTESMERVLEPSKGEARKGKGKSLMQKVVWRNNEINTRGL